MKTIVVYAQGSVFKYQGLHEYFSYFIEGDQMLTVYDRNIVTGDESECAIFHNWDYLLIETSSSE